jgi:hypothetical protein
VIRLLNRQLLGEEIDPVEAFEVLEPLESVVIGDIASVPQEDRGLSRDRRRPPDVPDVVRPDRAGGRAVEPAAHGRGADPEFSRAEAAHVGRVTADWCRKTFESVKNWGRWGADDQRGALHYITPERPRARGAPRCATASR